MKYLVNESLDPYFNMAFDEFCLQSLDSDEPVFYLWRNSPSVIIGLNQNAYSEVNLPYLKEHGINLARRVTGGGAVYHDLGNVNYTITGRSRALEEDYPGYAAMMADVLRQLGAEAEVTGRNDILVDGRKVSGFAKRVWKDRLMVHGTLMFDVDLGELTRALSVPGGKLEASGIASVRSRVMNLKEKLAGIGSPEELMAAAGDILSHGGRDGRLELSPEQLGSIKEEADSKFRTWEWNFGKSREAKFSRKTKFACGTVSVDFSVDRGKILGLAFGGDFIGDLPSEDLAAALEGCRYERSAVEDVLKAKSVEKYFDGLRCGDLEDLLF